MWTARVSRPTARRMWSPCAPRTRGWSGTRKSPPAPRPASPRWACSTTGAACWSVTTTPAGTSSTPTWPGVQQCGAHLIRHCQGVLDLDPEVQQWAGQVQKALRAAARLVNAASATGKAINAKALADARWRYDQGVLVGISINLSRPWHKGNHPGLVLARRLQAK